jgi:hypothetical protein
MKVQPVMDDALLDRLKHLARAQGITP